MNITREMKIQIFSMKMDGKTLFEIAKETGCSVEEVVKAIDVKQRAMKYHKEWAYPNLEAWMRKNCVTLQKMADMCGVQCIAVHRWLQGKNDITKRNIDKILRTTGMTYEEAFGDPRKTDR